MSNYHLGVRECEVADRQFFHARAIYSFSQATSTTRANARQSGDTSARSHGYLRINERIRRARVQDEAGRMSVERALNIKMMVRIQPYRDSRKSATREETCEALTHHGTPSVWINVKHLPGAIDDHPKLYHLVCAKQTVDVGQGLGIGDMRPCSGTTAVSVEIGKICDGHRYVCHCAIAHRDVFYFAAAKPFPAPAKQTAHVRVGLFHSETECIHAVDVDDRVRCPGIDHQGGSPIVNGDRNK